MFFGLFDPRKCDDEYLAVRGLAEENRVKVLLTGSAIFTVSLLVHIAWWKIKLPKNQMNALLKLFICMFMAWTLFQILGSYQVGNHLAVTFLEHLYVTLYYFSIALTYTLVYSGIEADSPSLTIIRILAMSEQRGIEKDELYRRLDLDRFLDARLKALLNDKMLLRSGDTYLATKKGYMAMKVVTVYRQIMGVKEELG